MISSLRDSLVDVLSFSYQTMLLPSITVFCFFVFTIVTYRLCFHPLAKYPGPKLAAATRLYEAYYDVGKGGRYIFKVAELHKKYGPIVRISPNELHISDPTFHCKLFNREGRWDKDPFGYTPLAQEDRKWSASLITVEHYAHRRRRAAMNPFFSISAVLAMVPIMQKYIDSLQSTLDKYEASGAVMNFGAAAAATLLDIVHEVTTGEPLGILDDDDESGVKLFQEFEAVHMSDSYQGSKHFTLYAQGLMLYAIFLVTTGRLSTVISMVLTRRRTIRERYTALVEGQDEPDSQDEDDQPERPKSLIDVIFSSKNLPDSDKTVARISSEIDIVIGAALESTSYSLRLLLYRIYSTPTILSKLRAELDHAIATQQQQQQDQGPEQSAEHRHPSQQPLSLQQLERLPYLTATLTEALRFNPGVVGRLARIAPDRPIVYKQWVIPPGTPVSMTNYTMHMDESIYPDPETFRPERWLDAERNARFEYAFAPFSKGTRNCVGMNVAWAEMYLVMGMILPCYDFEFVGTRASDIEVGGDMLVPRMKTKNGVKVRVFDRKDCDPC